MDYTPSGRLIKYIFCCKGLKEGDMFDSPSVERFYKKLDKAKQILEKARSTADLEGKFMLAMDRLDELLCHIEKYEKLSEREVALAALKKELEAERQGKMEDMR